MINHFAIATIYAFLISNENLIFHIIQNAPFGHKLFSLLPILWTSLLFFVFSSIQYIQKFILNCWPNSRFDHPFTCMMSSEAEGTILNLKQFPGQLRVAIRAMTTCRIRGRDLGTTVLLCHLGMGERSAGWLAHYLLPAYTYTYRYMHTASVFFVQK